MWETTTDWDKLKDANTINMVNGELVKFVGQDQAKTQLKAFMGPTHFPNTLLVGEAGLGKTHLAKWIAGEKLEHVQLHKDLPIVRKDLSENCKFVILDECHLQKNAEWIFKYMEDPEWTFIGTTNMPEKLAEAFKSRFIIQIRLRPYTIDELTEMVLDKTTVRVPKKNARILASAAGGNPRQLERIVLTAKALGMWEPSEVLATVRINADGVTEEHLMYLEGIEAFDRPIGIQYLAATTGIDQTTLKRLERLLTEKGLIALMPNGRTLTGRGAGYLELMRERGLL
jgi:Holliday junction resolvasome RuvABC ATP-dependent DNA helicase subunit